MSESNPFLDDLRDGVEAIKAWRRGEETLRTTTRGDETILDMQQQDYAVVYERGVLGWVARVPDLPDCIASGETVEEAETRLREVIATFSATVRRQGQTLPRPHTIARTIAIFI